MLVIGHIRASPTRSLDEPAQKSHDAGMRKTDHLQRLLDAGIVAIIRAADASRLVDVAEALFEGGVSVMEVTFTVPKAERVLEQVANHLGDKVLLGAGTVLDTPTARTAVAAGAQFIVSPAVNLEVIRFCRRYDKLVMPGAFTPTEVLTAWEAGADIVKVFPAEVGGPGYLKALAGPLPQVRLMPTGGVNLETAASFLRAGACALGVGGSLVDPKLVADGDMSRITSLARQFVEVVRQTRSLLGGA
jgi:2-dehydro-3-deoxyphosphogluconate aldolase/(4S)-4-hydroxy-2-oxoglutarate aldolase